VPSQQPVVTAARNIQGGQACCTCPAAQRLAFCVQMVKKERRSKEVVTREYTVNLHKKLHSIKFKSRAPKAVKVIKQFASENHGHKGRQD